MLSSLLSNIKNDDLQSVKRTYEEFSWTNISFVLNKDEQIEG